MSEHQFVDFTFKKYIFGEELTISIFKESEEILEALCSIYDNIYTFFSNKQDTYTKEQLNNGIEIINNLITIDRISFQGIRNSFLTGEGLLAHIKEYNYDIIESILLGKDNNNNSFL